MKGREVATELRLERQVHGGFTLGRLADGRVVLVRGGLPGELVGVELETRKGVLFGAVSAVVEANPARVEAPRHPGLDLAHASYGCQLELKREVIDDALRRSLKREVEVPPVRPSPKVWAYRGVVQPAVSATGLGYRRPASSEVLVLDGDPVATEAVNAAWTLLVHGGVQRLASSRELVIRANDAGEALVCLISTAPPRALLGLAHELVKAGLAGVSHAPFDPRGRFRSGAERLAGARAIQQSFGELDLTVNASSFAQPNAAAAGELYRTLTEWAGSGASAWELYAGGGAIAMHLTARFAQVTALELDRSAVARGQRDAERLGLRNLRFERGDARFLRLPDDADLVVVNPPRAGLSAGLRDAVGRSGVESLIYVSCDVATWARDVADLEAKGLRLVRFEPFDLYPHTHHVELLSLLRRDA